MPKYTSPYQARIALSENLDMSVDQMIMIQDAINFLDENKIIVGKVSSAVELFLPAIKFKKYELVHYISVSHFRTDYLSVFLQFVCDFFEQYTRKIIEMYRFKLILMVNRFKTVVFMPKTALQILKLLKNR